MTITSTSAVSLQIANPSFASYDQFSLDLGAGCTFMVASIVWTYGTNPITGANYAGQPLTLIASAIDPNTSAGYALYTLQNPAAGAQTLSFTCNNSAFPGDLFASVVGLVSSNFGTQLSMKAGATFNTNDPVQDSDDGYSIYSSNLLPGVSVGSYLIMSEAAEQQLTSALVDVPPLVLLNTFGNGGMETRIWGGSATVAGDTTLTARGDIYTAGHTGMIGAEIVEVAAVPKTITKGPTIGLFHGGSKHVTNQTVVAPQFLQKGPVNGAFSGGSKSFAALSGAIFTLGLDKVAAADVTVHWATADGTAVSGTDYITGSGTLTIPAGSLHGSLEVVIPTGAGTGKTFNVLLTSPTGATFVGQVTSLTVPCTIVGGGGVITPPPDPGSLTYLTSDPAALHVLKDTSGAVYIPRTAHVYGFDSSMVLTGLYNKGYRTVTIGGVTTEGVFDQIKRWGFNGVRLSFCQDITWTTSGPPTTQNPWTTANGRKPCSGGFTDYVNNNLNPDLFTTTDPSLAGANPQPFKTCLEILDLIVAHCAAIGLRIILDMHCLAPNNSDLYGNTPKTQADAGNYANKKWFTTAARLTGGGTTGLANELRDETQAIGAWVALAARYVDQPAVCGCDIINEPAGGSWSHDASTVNLDSDLCAYYERVGAAIHAVNPDLLIVCEGVSENVSYGAFPDVTVQGHNPEDLVLGSFWSGGLTGVALRPVTLAIPGKVVYSPHEYGSYGGEALSFLTANQQAAWGNPTAKGLAHQYEYAPGFPGSIMPLIRSKSWAYISEQGIAPTWIGEMGTGASTLYGMTQNQVDSDALWLPELNTYMRAHSIGFNWFSWDALPGNGGIGLLPAWDSLEMNVAQKPFVDALTALPMLATTATPPVTDGALTQTISTLGGKIVTADGAQVVLKTFNWYGMEGSQLMPAMLGADGQIVDGELVVYNGGRGWRTQAFVGPADPVFSPGLVPGTVYEGILDQMKRLGFNCIRLPVCEDVTWDGALANTNINGGLNPDFIIGTTYSFQNEDIIPVYEVLDKIVDYCQQIGLYVLLDMHSCAPQDPNVGNGPNSTHGLWYTTATPTSAGTFVTDATHHTGMAYDLRNESQWINALTSLAARYQTKPHVLYDLINEPYATTWGDNVAATDWKAAATRGGNAILSASPNACIVVEGIFGQVAYAGSSQFGTYAEKLDVVQAQPVVLSTPNRVIYSPHSYKLTNQARYEADPSTYAVGLPPFWDAAWGYLVKDNIAPVLIGEFNGDWRDPSTLTGADVILNAQQDIAAIAALSAYCVANKISWAYFAVNAGGTGPVATAAYDASILNYHDFTTPDPNVMSKLTAMLAL